MTSKCDRSTGQCDGGCKQGWTGNICDQSKYFYRQCTFKVYYLQQIGAVLLLIYWNTNVKSNLKEHPKDYVDFNCNVYMI